MLPLRRPSLDMLIVGPFLRPGAATKRFADIKNMTTGAAQMDGGTISASAINTSMVRCPVNTSPLTRQVGIKKLVVFINKGTPP